MKDNELNQEIAATILEEQRFSAILAEDRTVTVEMKETADADRCDNSHGHTDAAHGRLQGNAPNQRTGGQGQGE